MSQSTLASPPSSAAQNGLVSAEIKLCLVLMGLAVLALSYFSWLGWQGRPLPVDDHARAGIIVALFSTSCCAVIFWVFRFKLYAFPVMFAGVSLCYSLGVYIAAAFEQSPLIWRYGIVPRIYYDQGLPLVASAFAALLVGTLAAKLVTHKKSFYLHHNKQSWRWEDPQIKVVRQFGYALFIVSIVGTLYYAARGTGIAIMFEYGYATRGGDGLAAAAATGGIPRLATALLNWFLPWSCLMIFACVRTVRERNIAIFVVLIACILGVLSGDRVVAVTLLISVMAISYLRGIRLNLGQLFAFALLIFFLISVWAGIRVVPIREWTPALFANTITESLRGDTVQTNGRISKAYRYPFSSSLEQLGESYQTLAGTLMQVPAADEHRWGADYIRPFTSAIPFLGSRLINSPSASGWIDDVLLNTDSFRGLGYLLIAEAYLNFGALGVVGIHLLLGYGLAMVWWSLERNTDPRWVAYGSIVVSSCYVWIRNDANIIGRPIVWCAILIFMLPSMIVKPLRLRRQAT